MPIYEYRCAACGHELESLQKLSDVPLSICPSCHQAELKKLVSAAGFQLKGSGWYATDFRNSGARPAVKDKAAQSVSNGSGESAGTSGSAAADAKPDAKSTEAKAAPAAATESKSTATTASNTKS